MIDDLSSYLTIGFIGYVVGYLTCGLGVLGGVILSYIKNRL